MGIIMNRTVDLFEMTQEIVKNPMIGFAPHAQYPSIVEDNTLVYLDITLRELEPEEGVFDFETIEKKNHLDRWKQEGKHVVLRVISDYPRSDEHMDIPDWLYEKTKGDGNFYTHSYGKGYAPNYMNHVFIAHHKKAVQALGRRYGSDTFISYVQLGSLGHWGEWHVNVESGVPPLPPEEIRTQYVLPYLNAFPNAKLLMRRPFRIAKTYDMGLYNDMMGHAQSTLQWIEWIERGGVFDQTMEEDALVPMPYAWKSAPIGGELTSSIPMSHLMTTHIVQTIDMLKDSNVSFLGPNIPNEMEKNEDYQRGLVRVLQKIGYQIGITKMVWTEFFSNRVTVNLTWENHGVAPMYWNWPVYLYFMDRKGTGLKKIPIKLSLVQLFPGKKVRTTTRFQLREIREEVHSVYVGIEDPMTNEPAVKLASNQERKGNLSLLKTIEK